MGSGKKRTFAARPLRCFAFLALFSLGWSCASVEPCPPRARVPALSGELDAVLFLIGDAGEPAPSGEPSLVALRAAVGRAVQETGADRVRAVFLGDNIYPSGLPPKSSSGFAEAQRKLDAQLAVFAPLPAPSSPVGIFVPGNHDWAHSRRDGLQRILDQAAYIAEASDGRAVLLPERGCPGPAVVDVGERLRILALDTHWWLRRAEKGTGCAAGSEAVVVELLERQLAAAGDRHVVIVGHHPFVSGGPHGGTTCAVRSWGLIAQDLPAPRYRSMIDSISSAFVARPPLIYAAGHDHGLQLLRKGGPPYFLVSGSGSEDHLTEVSRLEETLFCDGASGYLRLDFAADGRVRLSAQATSDAEPAVEIFSTELSE